MTSPWWFGLGGDHLYETCPARLRSLPRLIRSDLPSGQGPGVLDPLGTDVCAWCARVWTSRNAPEVAS